MRYDVFCTSYYRSSGPNGLQIRIPRTGRLAKNARPWRANALLILYALFAPDLHVYRREHIAEEGK